MLTIRPAQMHVFERSARGNFVVALASHLSERWPQLADAGFQERVAAMVERAVGYGFRDRGHIAAWADLECRYGTGFEELPEYEDVRNVLQIDLGPAVKLYKIDRRLHPPQEDV